VQAVALTTSLQKNRRCYSLVTIPASNLYYLPLHKVVPTVKEDPDSIRYHVC